MRPISVVLGHGTPTPLQRRQHRRFDGLVPRFGSFVICRLVYGIKATYLDRDKVNMGPGIRSVRCKAVSDMTDGGTITAHMNG